MSTAARLVEENVIADVRHGFDLFFALLKKQAFYPEGNASIEQSITAFYEWLGGFLARRSVLRITVEKSRLLYEGEVVEEEKDGERGGLIFPLFRDGMQWFEFHGGVSMDEVRQFVKLICQYRDLREESENDLVTALWEADFPCIKHKAVDNFWESKTLISISNLQVVKPGEEGEGAIGGAADPSLKGGFGPGVDDAGEGGDPVGSEAGCGAEAPKKKLDKNASMFLARLEQSQAAGGVRVHVNPETSSAIESDTEIVGQFWKLTLEEEAQLRDLITVEERRDATKDCLNVLLVLSCDSFSGEDKIILQDFICESVKHLLFQADFTCVRSFVERLIATRAGGDKEDARFAEETVAKIAGPSVLGALNRMWSLLPTVPRLALDNLRRLLLMLPPIALDSLIPMVARESDPRIMLILLDAIAYHAGKSRSDVSHLISSMPPGFISEMIGVYSTRGLTPPVDLLTKLTRHREPLVRQAAAKALVVDNPENLKTIFHMINDPDRTIGLWLLSELGKERNPVAENLLIEYLTEECRKGGVRDEEFAFECYRTLGRCASKASIEFLREILMKKSWAAVFGFERSVHRIGAAMALSLMPRSWGARKVLQDAEHSRVIGIRRAHTRAQMTAQKMLKRSSE
ncbi:MAG: hypothetical protein LBJ46_03650 [Planctomycetota bacterium]|nr:hypothetical protein [Planctomycetota bacterium]